MSLNISTKRAAFFCAFMFCSVLMINPVFAADVVDPAIAAGLAPHKALYDIKLSGTRSGSQIVNISGQMLYEWHPSCEAWASTHRFDLTYEYADSPAMRITSDFSTYETFDGKEMNFTSQRKREGQVFEELRGHANLNASGAGLASYSIPKELEYKISEGGVFPMGHTLGLIESINKGEKFYNATIFDGSDDDGPVNINAFIGKAVEKITAIEDMKDIDSALLTLPAREIQLAFFPIQDETETADYEMNLVFHKNGVISSMMVNYENFSVSQTLKAIEAVESKNCDAD